jgi:hypothetical protein
MVTMRTEDDHPQFAIFGFGARDGGEQEGERSQRGGVSQESNEFYWAGSMGCACVFHR